MTRQEAKKIMENEVRCVRNPNCERLECRNCYLVMPEHTVLKAYDVAIKALEQEPCDYAISREAVMKIVDEEWLCNADYDFRSLVESLEKLPPVNPQEPKTDVLDKIRAEIAEYKDDKVIHDERNEMIDIVLDIIDKYKVESEEQV